MGFLTVLIIWVVLAIVGYAVVRVGASDAASPQYFDGFWNGEKADFRVVTIVVGDQPDDMKSHFQKFHPDKKQYLWFVPFLGEQRQAVEVVYAGQTFYMDNEDGTGLYKVTGGKGSPTCGHATIYPAEILHEVAPDKWIQTSDLAKMVNRNRIDLGWMAIDPIGYSNHRKQMQKIEAAIRRNRSIFQKAN